MLNEIVKWGGIASAITALTVLITKTIKGIRGRVSAKEENKRRQDEMLTGIKDTQETVVEINTKLKDVADKLSDTQDDVAALQVMELKLAHSKLMRLGWCSDEEKSGVLDLYDRYKIEKSRDSLMDSFAKDIRGLPPYPPEPTGQRRRWNDE